MNIHVKGKVILEGVECHHCKNTILDSYILNTEICKSCGARYDLISTNVENNLIDAEYIFGGFNCMEQGWLEKCTNICPAPFMYCRQHSNDDSIKKAEREIEEAKGKVDQAKSKLDTIRESKKTWIVTKLSGMDNDEQDSIPTE